MTRIARIVVPGLPHQLTQRGNHRAAMFFEDGDYVLCRDLLAAETRRAGAEVWSFVLMPNHVHLILTAAPSGPGFAQALEIQRARPILPRKRGPKPKTASVPRWGI